MKKISLLLAILLTLAIVLTGCGSSNGASSDSMVMNAGTTESATSGNYSPEVDYGYGTLSGSSDGGTDSIYENPDNKIIRTANLTIQTTEFDDAVTCLNNMTERYGGYYETAQVSGGSYYNQKANRSAYYVVRIPSENYTAFRDGTDSIGHVYNMSESSDDVGETYYDTEARLATLTTKRERLLALLEKAEIMEDIISLENALADVQYQIDQHTATLRKYDSLIGYSTFYINLNEVQKIVEEPAVTQSFGSKLLSNLKTGFEDFGEGLQDFALWFARNLIGILIFLAIVAVVIVIVVRRIRRRRAPRQQAE